MKVADLFIRARCTDHHDQDQTLKTQKHMLRKFCLENEIKIRKTILSDGPADQFDQQPWTAYIKNLRRTKNKPELLLFTNWDRLSRNIEKSLSWVAKLGKMGVQSMSTADHKCGVDLFQYLVSQLVMKELQDEFSNRSARIKAGIKMARKNKK